MRKILAVPSFLIAGLAMAANCGRAANAPASPSPATVSATAPTDAQLTTAMKAAWESPANGLNPGKTIEIKSIKVSAVSRLWANQADVGSAGNHIWTARIHFLQRTIYASRTVVFDYDYYIDTSVNTMGEWVVQNSSQDGSKRTALPDEPGLKK